MICVSICHIDPDSSSHCDSTGDYSAGWADISAIIKLHKIKALHDVGNGLSIRAISQELNLSRNTVRKYLRMDEKAISFSQRIRPD